MTKIVNTVRARENKRTLRAPREFTTISSWALLIAKALGSQGHDSRAIFRRAGLDPDRLYDANARYPVAGMQRLWAHAVQATQDPCFGLRVVKFWHPTTMHALGYAWMASQSLLDAFERTARYARVVSTAAKVSLEETAEEFRFTLMHHVEVRDEAIDASLAWMVKACRISAGADFAPLRVTMRRPRPSCDVVLARYFRAPIDYEAPQNVLSFDKAALRAPLPTGNPELERASHKVLLDYLARLDRTEIFPQVRAKLVEQLPAGQTTAVSIANALHVSPRTLQRRLNEAGTTFNAVLEDTRRELAQWYLKQPDLAISEIAYLLGFSETGNFSRAFKRWTGASPRDYRSQGLGGYESERTEQLGNSA
ncbi:MAG: AraC family transcriptional regulator [Gammaproteobacteria bacterium]